MAEVKTGFIAVELSLFEGESTQPLSREDVKSDRRDLEGRERGTGGKAEWQ